MGFYLNKAICSFFSSIFLLLFLLYEFVSFNQIAFVTLATNDAYCKGAAVLGKSLRKVKTQRELVVMVTPDVSKDARDVLESIFDVVTVVDVLDSKDASNLAMLKRPELGVTFTKLHCWKLVKYNKCVFLDADTLVVADVDDLFSNDEFSAVADCGWPDMFNSGVFVFKPSEQTFTELIDLAQTEGSFDGGDQGLLNSYFTKWNRISFVYNMQATSFYTYTPAFVKFGANTKIVHFLGSSVKPWNSPRSDSSSGSSQKMFINEWWNIHDDLPTKFNELTMTAGTSGKLAEAAAAAAAGSVKVGGEGGHHADVGPERAYDAVAHFNKLRQGQVDVHGDDSFDVIQKKIDESISK